MALYEQDTVQKKRELPVIFDWETWFVVMQSRIYGTKFSVPAMKTGLFKEQRLGKETQEEILLEKKHAKTETLEIVLIGPRKASVREEIRAASNTLIKTKGKGARRRPVVLPTRYQSGKSYKPV